MTNRQTSPASLQRVRHWSTDRAKDWAYVAIPKLCSDPNVLAVVAVGSSVRQVSRPYDFDCLYIYTHTRPHLEGIPHDVDLRGFDQAQIDELITKGHDLLVWTIKFGRVVCEKDDFWTKVTSRWLPRLPFPSAGVADQRAARAEKLLEDLRNIGDTDAVIEQHLTVLTHRARASLLREGVFPASRPELPDQLRQIGQHDAAKVLEGAIAVRDSRARSQEFERATT